MEEGDKNVGGLQPNPINTTTQNVGPQPTTFGTAIQPERPAIPTQPNPIQRNIQSAFPYHPNSSASYAASTIQHPIQQASQFQQFSSQPTTTNTGDIVLSSAPTKKSKKPFLIVVIILFVIAAGIGGYFAVQYFNGGTNSGQTLANNYREAFNEYANYILYGEDSIEDIVEPSNNNTYYAIWSAADEKDTNFFDKAKKLLENFLNRQEESSDELLETFITGYSDIFDFYYLYNIKPRTSSSYITELYIKEGKNSAIKYIEENYETFENSSELAQDYGSKQKEIDLSILEQIDIANINGCIENNTINQGCLSTLDIDFTEQRKPAAEYIQSIIYDAGHNIVFDCFTIANEIYSSEKEQNDTE